MPPPTNDPINEWLLALAGPLSWIIYAILAIGASQGPDGGWTGMAVMWTGIAIIILIHIISPFVLTYLAIVRRKKKEAIGKVIISGIAYYGLFVTMGIIMAGPKELFSDVIVILGRFFGS